MAYDELTAQENLTLFAKLQGVENAAERVSRLLEEVGLSERRNSLVRTFSRGMRQRVAIARALLHAPSILLFDEPATGLDPEGVSWLAGTLRNLRDAGCTIVMSVHGESEVAALATRAVRLEAGRVAADRRQGERDFEICGRVNGAAFEYNDSSRQGAADRVPLARIADDYRGLHSRGGRAVQLYVRSHHHGIAAIRTRIALAGLSFCGLLDAAAVLFARAGQRHAKRAAARRRGSVPDFSGQARGEYDLPAPDGDSAAAGLFDSLQRSNPARFSATGAGAVSGKPRPGRDGHGTFGNLRASAHEGANAAPASAAFADAATDRQHGSDGRSPGSKSRAAMGLAGISNCVRRNLFDGALAIRRIFAGGVS